MELYIGITIAAFLILIGGAIYGWVREEVKLTKLKESHKKAIETLKKENMRLQLKIIELESKKHLKITLDNETK